MNQRHHGQRYSGLSSHLFSDDSIFESCEFDRVVDEGARLSGCTFSDCTFNQADFYWCQAFESIFLNCRFVKCDLRGNFDAATFTDCRFEECSYGKDNLGGETRWEGAVAQNCEVLGEPLPIV